LSPREDFIVSPFYLKYILFLLRNQQTVTPPSVENCLIPDIEQYQKSTKQKEKAVPVNTRGQPSTMAATSTATIF